MTGEDNREYFGMVDEFLRMIHQLKVRSVCMVALIDSDDTFDVVSCFGAGPMEIAASAGILQMHAAHKYEEVNREEDNDAEDDT